MKPGQKPYEALAAGVGALGLVTQFFFSVAQFVANGMTTAGAIVTFFSFFTILGNIFAVLFYVASLFDFKGALTSPRWQTAMAIYMAIIGTIYIAILQGIWEPQGIFKVLDITLHYITPALAVIYWLFFIVKGQTLYGDSTKWVIPGILYVIYALTRGAITNAYPYPFLDASNLGYALVARNVVFLLVFFFILSLVVVTLDHALARRQRSN